VVAQPYKKGEMVDVSTKIVLDISKGPKPTEPATEPPTTAAPETIPPETAAPPKETEVPEATDTPDSQ
jgi:beta-lactam-binding protein with PASTA domain